MTSVGDEYGIYVYLATRYSKIDFFLKLHEICFVKFCTRIYFITIRLALKKIDEQTRRYEYLISIDIEFGRFYKKIEP